MNSGYHSSELSSVITQHERKLCSRLQMDEKIFVAVYRVYSVNSDKFLCGYV
jgi:hypothetical protein